MLVVSATIFDAPLAQWSMPGCYYSPAGYLPVTYFSSPTLLQSEWANGQVRSSHVKTPVASSLVEPTTSALRVTIKMADVLSLHPLKKLIVHRIVMGDGRCSPTYVLHIKY